MTALKLWRQLPMTARMAAIAVAMVFIGGCADNDQQPARLASPATETTTSTTTTTTTPPPVTVTSVVDGRTLKLSDGRQVVLDALAQPGECWAVASAEFATKTLVDKPIQLVGTTSVLLADGTDYAVLAAGQGAARAANVAVKAVQDAQAAAKQAALGFWGPSCGGLDVKPAPPPAPKPQPVVPQPQPQPPPQPKPQPPAAVYYKNCAAARAAGVTPLYRGQPGYGSHLDRDNDGVACE